MTGGIAILGAGGHARVIADAILLNHVAGKGLPLAGFIGLDNPGNLPARWLGNDDALPDLIGSGQVLKVIIGVGSIRGGPGLRQALQATADAAGCEYTSVIHPAAVISPGARLGTGVAVMAGAVINTGAVIGNHAIINTCASVDHDCHIGAHTHIAPGATLSGDVTTGNAVLVGVGAVCRQGISIGASATLGAGAVAVDDIADGAVCTGCPARAV
jgi:UDP-perosamine 4-acetyltransferase